MTTAGSPSALLLDREAELEALDTAVRSAEQGSGRLVVVEGAVGEGKTALLAAARREPADRTSAYSAPGAASWSGRAVRPGGLAVGPDAARRRRRLGAIVPAGDGTGCATVLGDRDWVVVSQSPAAGTAGGPETRLVFTVLAYGDAGAPAMPNRSQSGRMPKLVCFDLQEAQDTLQSAGFTIMASEDAMGQNRSQLVDRNWTVTGQTPGPRPQPRQVDAGGVLKAVKTGAPSSCKQAHGRR